MTKYLRSVCVCIVPRQRRSDHGRQSEFKACRSPIEG